MTRSAPLPLPTLERRPAPEAERAARAANLAWDLARDRGPYRSWLERRLVERAAEGPAPIWPEGDDR